MDNYPYFNSGNRYYFTTQQGIIYTVEFYEAPELVHKDFAYLDIHSIVFFPNIDYSQRKANRNLNMDELVSATIIKIIEYFIADYDCPILFVCDADDIEAMARYRLFKSWYSCYERKNLLVQFREYRTETTYYTGIIYNRNDPFAKQILEMLENPDILDK